MMSNVLGFQGVSPADIELVTKALNALYDYGWKKTSADALDQAIERLREKPGLEDFEALSSRHQIPDSLYARQRIGDPAWFFHLDPDRDVLEAYSRLRCPVLVIYGRYDYTVPVDESMTAINTALEASAHPDYRVEVLDHTGHGTLIVSADAPHEPVQPLHVSGQYFSLLTEWLSGHGFTLAGR